MAVALGDRDPTRATPSSITRRDAAYNAVVLREATGGHDRAVADGAKYLKPRTARAPRPTRSCSRWGAPIRTPATPRRPRSSTSRYLARAKNLDHHRAQGLVLLAQAQIKIGDDRGADASLAEAGVEPRQARRPRLRCRRQVRRGPRPLHAGRGDPREVREDPDPGRRQAAQGVRFLRAEDRSPEWTPPRCCSTACRWASPSGRPRRSTRSATCTRPSRSRSASRRRRRRSRPRTRRRTTSRRSKSSRSRWKSGAWTPTRTAFQEKRRTSSASITEWIRKDAGDALGRLNSELYPPFKETGFEVRSRGAPPGCPPSSTPPTAPSPRRPSPPAGEEMMRGTGREEESRRGAEGAEGRRLAAELAAATSPRLSVYAPLYSASSAYLCASSASSRLPVLLWIVLSLAACGGAKTVAPKGPATLALPPANPQAVGKMVQGVQAARDGQRDRAAALLREAISLDANLWEARYDLGAILGNEGDLAGSEDQLGAGREARAGLAGCGGRAGRSPSPSRRAEGSGRRARGLRAGSSERGRRAHALRRGQAARERADRQSHRRARRAKCWCASPPTPPARRAVALGTSGEGRERGRRAPGEAGARLEPEQRRGPPRDGLARSRQWRRRRGLLRSSARPPRPIRTTPSRRA